MSLYVLRLRDGNCIVVDAPSEQKARERARPLAASEVATARKLDSFVAQFALNDDGQLSATLLDKKTISDLHRHEYPLLHAAHTHSYLDFDDSETDNTTDAVLYDSKAHAHARDWDTRDKDIVQFAVQQERLRFAN
jgi:hypothetical protein